MNDPNIHQCPCCHCGETLEFPAGLIGRTVACPHCRQETLLFVPPSPDQAPAAGAPVTVKYGLSPETIGLPHQAPAIRGGPGLMRLFGALQAGLLILCAGFLIAIWHNQRQAAIPQTWEYNQFQFDGVIFPAWDTNACLQMAWDDPVFQGDSRGLTNIAGDYSESRPVFGVSQILSRAGEDGWRLAWTDGTNYLVSRPCGRWDHDSFILRYAPYP